MGRPPGVLIDSAKFVELCQLLGVTAGNAREKLGISSRSFQVYGRRDTVEGPAAPPRVPEARLSDMVERAGRMADRAGKGPRAWSLCRQMVAGAADQRVGTVAELFLQPLSGYALGPVPEISTVFDRSGQTIDRAYKKSRECKAAEADALFEMALAEGENPVEVWVGQGHNWYDNGLPDRSIGRFERALQARTSDEAIALCVVKGHLATREGDMKAHWERAVELIAWGRARRASPWRNRWRMWEIVAVFRRPADVQDPRTYAEVDRRISKLLVVATADNDWDVIDFCRCQGVVARFRSIVLPVCRTNMKPGEVKRYRAKRIENQKAQRQAIRQMQKYINTQKSKALIYRRAICLKNLANMIVQAQGADPEPDRSVAVAYLKRAIGTYSRSRKNLVALGLTAECAMVDYSAATAYQRIAQLFRRRPANRRAAMRHFASAERCLSSASAAFEVGNYPFESANTSYNIAMNFHERLCTSKDERIELLSKAADSYVRALSGYANIQGEFDITIAQLGRALRALSRLVDAKAVVRIVGIHRSDLVSSEPRLADWFASADRSTPSGVVGRGAPGSDWTLGPVVFSALL